MKHIEAIISSGSPEIQPCSYECGALDICKFYDKADVCVISDMCDYDMDGGSFCVIDACGIDVT